MGQLQSLQNTLTNRHVNIKLRLKLFDATVTPAALYGLTSCPLTNTQLARLDTTMRKMLRRLVGWVHSNDDETWEQRGHRMKTRLDTALSLFKITPWSERVMCAKRLQLNKVQCGSAPLLVCQTFEWSPWACHHLNAQPGLRSPHRRVGRPAVRWFDYIHEA